MELYFPVILDGATGTQLQKRGYTGAECAEKWILEHPEAILDIQRRYVAAGSRILYAPTFSANRIKLGEHGLADRVEEYNLRLTELTRTAAEGKAWVAGDLSPVGRFLAPMGDVLFEELVDVYTQQVAALEKAGVDLYVIETMMTMAEARAAVLAVRSMSEKPVLVSFTCDGNGRTLTGTDVTAALAVMEGMGVDAFGLNCSAGPGEMLEQLRRLGKTASIPLAAKPNAGLPQVEDGQTVYQCPPEEFTACLPEMAAAGVTIFGGCCGTEEGHIAALKEALRTVEMMPPAPENRGELLCATEREAFWLDPATSCAATILCDERLGEELERVQEEEPLLIALEIRSGEQLSRFGECQWQIRVPLCIRCDDAALLEKALRLYQGRALYEGALPETVLEPLAEKYGLVY